MTEIQGKSILVRVSARFKLARVRVIGSQLYLLLNRNLLMFIITNIIGLVSCAFLQFCCKFSMKIIFYLPVNTDRPKFVTFLVFVCTSSFIAWISSIKNVSKRDAILALVAKQWMAKAILSYESQSKCAKIAIHWFGKY